MHAFLIIGKTKELRVEEITKRITDLGAQPWDIVRPTGAGIEAVRNFRRELSIAPRGKIHVGVIEDIQLLTIEAQNALLKTLEEPPPHTYIIAETDTPDILLPTIRSRFSVVSLGPVSAVTMEIPNAVIETILVGSPGKILFAIEPFVDTADHAKAFVTALIYRFHQMLPNDHSKKITTILRNLLAAQSQLSVNVNPRLVVDNALII